jgi:hypothetical protein
VHNFDDQFKTYLGLRSWQSAFLERYAMAKGAPASRRTVRTGPQSNLCGYPTGH